ncbi:MAG: histidine kinase, partial [Actinomycetota bacterium]|nr:histidine kinase [Actinomycetota bacterium]
MTVPARDGFGAVRDDMAGLTRMWGGRWGRFLFPGFWLVYLGSTISHIADHETGWQAITGYVLVAAFAICYLVALPMGWTGRTGAFWPLFAVAVLLTVTETFFAQASALGFCVYLAVLMIASHSRAAPYVVAALVLISGLLPRFLHSWGGKIDWNTPLTVFLVSIAMIGFFKIIQSNIALAAARAEVARLAAENERSRIARDLHDLLGHSLTAITVKTGLARRLAERSEADRALAEIREIEVLARRTLADVRAAVAGHRDVTLAGELATSREVLRASGINAELPGSVDVVDPAFSEVFGWVLREGVTNLVRHSRAGQCEVTIGARWIEINDDGVGGTCGAGNGLTGLNERMAAIGGTAVARPTERGWRLRAEVPG